MLLWYIVKITSGKVFLKNLPKIPKRIVPNIESDWETKIGYIF